MQARLVFLALICAGDERMTGNETVIANAKIFNDCNLRTVKCNCVCVCVCVCEGGGVAC